MKIQSARGNLVRTGMVTFLAAMLASAVFLTPPVMAQSPGAAPAATPAEDPAVTASRQAFEVLPEAERKAIQEALIWVVPYNATAGGTFGRQTYNGIMAFQKAAGAPPTGILTPQAATALKSAANVARAAVGFKVLRDDKTGVGIGVPLKALTKQGANPAGSRWQSPDDKITLDTRTLPGAGAELQAQFDRAIAAAPGRKVTYKFQRPDFFVVTGETANGEFYVRYALGPDGLRGFTYAYDKSVKADATRFMIAIANSFVPFPGNVAPPLPLAQAPGVSATAVMPMRVTADAVKVSTGIRVGPRQVLAIGLACSTPRVGGISAKVIKQAGDLTLLDMGTDKPVAPLPLRSGPLAAGSGLVMVGWDASARAVAVVSGSSEDSDGVIAPLQAGGRGGLVFDRYGAVVGMVGNARTPSRVLSGVAMPSSYAVINTKTVQEFIGGAGAFVGEASETNLQTAGSIGAGAAPRIVDITCP